jgi:hypothetical protein
MTAGRLARPAMRQVTRRIEAMSGRIGRGWSGLREARVVVIVVRRRAGARREDFVGCCFKVRRDLIGWITC